MLPETSVKHSNVWKLYRGKAFVSLSWFVLQRMLQVRNHGRAADKVQLLCTENPSQLRLRPRSRGY